MPRIPKAKPADLPTIPVELFEEFGDGPMIDALRVTIREDAVVRNKAVYLALGVLPDGTRDIVGLWSW